MANPVLSHLVSGKVYGLFGTGNILAGATVTVKHSTIGPTAGISETTNAQGEYIINLSGLDSQWSVGDEITVTATKTAEGTKTVTATITSGGGQTVNLTLAETSILVYDTNPVADEDVHNLNFNLITHYDGEKVTRLRPFPVQTEDPLDKYQPADDDFNSDPNYTGFTDRLGNWYIVEDNIDSGTHRYTKGSSNYETNWTNRASLSYNYFHETF